MTTADTRFVAEEVGAPALAAVPAASNRGLRSWQHRYLRWLWVSDTAVILAVVGIAQTLRFGGVTGAALASHRIDYVYVSIAVAVLWSTALMAYRSRAVRILGSGLEEYQRVWTATLVVFGGIAVASTVFKLDIARGYLALAFPLGLVALTANRWLARQVVIRQRRLGRFTNAVLAVGRADSVSALAEALAHSRGEGYTVVGICGPGLAHKQTVQIAGVGDIPVYPHGADLAATVVAAGADTVAITSGQLTPDEIRDLSWQLEKLDVELVVSPGMVDIASPRLMMRPVGGLPLIHVDKPQYDGAKRFQKRFFDVCFSGLVLVVAAPLMALVALAIKLDSPGPVFYLCERIGLGGKQFRMIKFRTMVVDADQRLAEVAHLNDGNGVLFKIRQDPRVTAVGKFLRRYSIDELPQFINVLRRDMSVVGPRPPLPSEVASYDDQVRRRLLVRPGITGLWQVSGRSDLSWEESVRLDLFYVENWSMLSDLAIAMKTVRTVLRGSGAY